jgi:hypothetical protein
VQVYWRTLQKETVKNWWDEIVVELLLTSYLLRRNIMYFRCCHPFYNLQNGLIDHLANLHIAYSARLLHRFDLQHLSIRRHTIAQSVVLTKKLRQPRICKDSRDDRCVYSLGAGKSYVCILITSSIDERLLWFRQNEVISSHRSRNRVWLGRRRAPSRGLETCLLVDSVAHLGSIHLHFSAPHTAHSTPCTINTPYRMSLLFVDSFIPIQSLEMWEAI